MLDEAEAFLIALTLLRITMNRNLQSLKINEVTHQMSLTANFMSENARETKEANKLAIDLPQKYPSTKLLIVS